MDKERMRPFLSSIEAFILANLKIYQNNSPISLQKNNTTNRLIHLIESAPLPTL